MRIANIVYVRLRLHVRRLTSLVFHICYQSNFPAARMYAACNFC